VTGPYRIPYRNYNDSIHCLATGRKVIDAGPFKGPNDVVSGTAGSLMKIPNAEQRRKTGTKITCYRILLLHPSASP
jgi:hypothetical protein